MTGTIISYGTPSKLVRFTGLPYLGEVLQGVRQVFVEVVDLEGHPDPGTVHCGVQPAEAGLSKMQLSNGDKK
jgi:hypothetical protein